MNPKVIPAIHPASTDQNISVVTAASNSDYIREDLDVFSFKLTAAEMATLAAI